MDGVEVEDEGNREEEPSGRCGARLGRRATLALLGVGTAGAALLGGRGALGSARPPRAPLAEARPGVADAAEAPFEIAPRLPLPPRAAGAPAGSEIARRLAGTLGAARERALLDEVLGGNVPAFLRNLVAVEIAPAESGDGVGEDGGEPAGAGGRSWIFVAPDYLAVGADDDFLRVPLTGAAAQRVADALGCVLPTPRIVDAIHEAAAQLVPRVLEASPEMTSTSAVARHHAIIEAQRRAASLSPGALLAGHKKDVVVTARLARRPDRVAIYGLHWPGRGPVQPLSLVHAAAYVDYAHGVRLVWGRARLGARTVAIRKALGDPALAAWLSDEGPIAEPRYPTELPA